MTRFEAVRAIVSATMAVDGGPAYLCRSCLRPRHQSPPDDCRHPENHGIPMQCSSCDRWQVPSKWCCFCGVMFIASEASPFADACECAPDDAPGADGIHKDNCPVSKAWRV